MKLQRRISETFMLLIAVGAITIGFSGAIASTISWYQYSTRAGSSFGGTAVGFDGGLNIALVSERKINRLVDEFDLHEEIVGDEYYYWSATGLSYEHVECYNDWRGYATTSLSASTSGSYSHGDDFTLYRSPAADNPKIELPAMKGYYSNIRLSFKEANYDGTRSDMFLEMVTLDSQFDIKESARISFTDEHTNKTILFAPSREMDGSTDVAGPLNLNKDIYYDNVDKKEVIYGEYEDISYLQPYQEDIKVGDGNTTFDAWHLKGVQGATYTPKKAEYYGFNSVIGNKMTILQASHKNYRPILNMNIYIEGWDKTCIEKDLLSYFTLYMTFAI